ncbi:MAG: thiamine-phosphate kinase [Candidatus Hadarchaeales archaeon]
MRLREVGERKLLERVRRLFPSAPWVEVGIGDDGAVLRSGGDKLVVCSDMLTYSRDLPPGSDLFYLGWKAVVSNLSDLAAMGARPLALLFSLGLPPDLEEREANRILLGIRKASSLHEVPVVGGDFSGCEEVVVSGTGLGKAKRVLLREGASPGELLALTGEVGAAGAGLEVLKRKRKGYERLVRSFLQPKARVREGEVLAERGVTSAIDLSDGLAQGLWRLAEESGVKLRVNPSSLPLSPQLTSFCEREGLSPLDFALYGGEDFELLFTLPPRRWQGVRKALEGVGCRAHLIGRVERGRGVLLGEKKLPDRGYEHYRNGP